MMERLSLGLLSLKDWSESDFRSFFKEMERVSHNSEPNSGFGILAFFEPSTRTRVSFEAAGLLEGFRWIQISGTESSLLKGESLRDTFLALSEYGPQCFVIRHPTVGVPHWVSEWTQIPVLNAGDGAGEHPTQGLLDAYTIWQETQKGGRRPATSIKIALLGDLEKSRVVRSDLDAFLALGWTVNAVDDGTKATHLFAKSFSLPLVARKALSRFDFVCCYRLQKERDSSSVAACLRPEELKKDAKVLHPGPVIWGEDLSKEFLTFAASPLLIQKQIENGLKVRRLLLRALLKRSPSMKFARR